MKIKIILLSLILVFCIVGTVFFMVVLPDQVPMHYNFSGEADRIGSKFENALWPVLDAGMEALFLVLLKQDLKKGLPSNQKSLFFAGIISMSVITLSGFYTMWKAVQKTSPATVGGLSEMVPEGIGLGVLMIVLGCVIPKCRRNSVMGLRTKWSMANDGVWEKSQMFCGVAMIVAGILMIGLTLLVPARYAVLMWVLIVVVTSIIAVAASWYYYHHQVS